MSTFRQITTMVLLTAALAFVPSALFAADKAAPEKVIFGLISFNKIPDSTADINETINSYIQKTYPDSQVAIDLQVFGPADYNQKINLSIASGKPIDIFDPVPLGVFVSKKQLLPLENLIDKFGQGIKKVLERDFGPGLLKTTVFDDYLYAIPVNKGMALNMTLCFDKDLLALSGYTEKDIKSLEDLPAIFAAIKKKRPDVIPFAPINIGDTQLLSYISQKFEIDTLSDNLINTAPVAGVTIGKNPKVVNIYETKEFADGVKMMRDWSKKGYLPKDAGSSQTIAQEYFKAGRLFCTLGGYSGNQAGIALSASSGRNIGTKHLVPVYFNTQTVNFVTMAIASNTKVPEAAMKLLNLLYTDEFITNTILYGIEGRDYVKVDSHHWKYPDGKDANTVPYTAALCTGVFGSESLQLQPVGTDWNDVLQKLKDNKDSKRSPFFGFSFDPSELKNEYSAISNVVNQYVPGLTTGIFDPNETLPKFNAALKKAGIDKIIAEKQKQLNAWLSKNK